MAGKADLLVTNAKIVALDADCRVIGDGALAASGGRITHVGTSDELAPLAGQAARVHDAGGMILMPGLVNAHCHAADSLFRGLVENASLEDWLKRIWVAESAVLDPGTVETGATLGLAELLLAGVTSVMDMFWYPDSTVAAASRLGMRVATGPVFFDGPGIDGFDTERRTEEAHGFFGRHGGSETVFACSMPHGTYTVCPENLRLAHGIAREHGGLFSTHAAETAAEQADISKRYGRSVVRHLNHLGALDGRSVLAHCVHVDDEEIGILARTGAVVAHNPVSNLKLGSGIAPIGRMLDAGVRIALGTDGAVSGNDINPWLAMRLAAMLPKGITGRPDLVSPRQVLEMATANGARALGQGDSLGSLEAGKHADMVLLDVDAVHAVPMFDPLTHLVYSASKSDVRHVFVGGEQVVEDRRIVNVDIAGTVAEVRGMAPRIAAALA